MNISDQSERDWVTRRRFLARIGVLGLAAGAGPLFAGCGGGGDVLGRGDNNGDDTDLSSLPLSGTLERSDAQMRAVVQQFLAFNVPPLTTLTPQQARLQPAIQDAARQIAQAQGRVFGEPVASAVDRTIPGPAGPLAVRVYTPSGTGPFPVIVYFHGGGWVIATINTYDSSCRALANAARAVVVSVEYRKGPENRFPAAHEDAYAATQYVIANAAEFGGDASRVAVAGESAGGNLAAAVCLLARDRGGVLPVHQLLVYPIADTNPNRPSFVENANAVPLSRPLAAYFLANYLNGPADYDSPLIALARTADLHGLPPATVITDEIDPLRSEGQALISRLRDAGVSVRSRNVEDVTHEFFGMGAVVDKAKDAVDFAAEGLRDTFDN